MAGPVGLAMKPRFKPTRAKTYLKIDGDVLFEIQKNSIKKLQNLKNAKMTKKKNQKKEKNYSNQGFSPFTVNVLANARLFYEGQSSVLYQCHFLNLLTALCFVKIITLGENLKPCAQGHGPSPSCPVSHQKKVFFVTLG